MNPIRKAAFAFLLSGVCFFSSCNEQELGNNYYFLSDYEAEDIGYPYGSMVYKSEEKSSFSDIKIIADISKVNHNNRYIIILQKPNKEKLAKSLKYKLLFWKDYYLKNSSRDSSVQIETGEKICLSKINDIMGNEDSASINKTIDSLTTRSFFYDKVFKTHSNYYIIDKKSDKLYGPLRQNEFKALKAEKNIHLSF